MKQSISVVLAVYNEEKYLPDCLESVKNFADEIVIVDGSSTDNTVAIAKQYGAKVHVTTNPPMFHINKQMAIDLASKGWILQLDADERVTPELEKEIISVINKSSGGPHVAGAPQDDFVGYWIPRKNWFLGRFLMKGGVYPDYTLRLYKRGKGHLPLKDVHEQAVVDGEVGYLKNPLIHIADPEFKRYIKRFNRYTSLIAKEFKEKNTGKNPINTGKYMLFMPIYWFLLAYIRHKGFMDSWQGFVFAFFSGLRFPVAYIKYLRYNK